MVTGALTESGPAPKPLVFEIMESVTIVDAVETRRVLNASTITV
jgi:hypothetical protein